MSASLTLRKAAPHELSALVALDAAASALYDSVGLHVDLPETHPFVLAEQSRWGAAVQRGAAFVVAPKDGNSNRDDAIAAFAVLGEHDGVAYLDQLSVHPTCMRRGIGSALLRHVISTNGAGPLWLTTYAHVPWNAPFYVRFGFRVVPETSCGPELRQVLAIQRAALPDPEQRVAMVREP